MIVLCACQVVSRDEKEKLQSAELFHMFDIEEKEEEE